MSVDDRLREAFGETDRSWDEQVPVALAAVISRRRHESVVRRGAAAALVAAAAVATVAVTVSQRTDDAPSPSDDPTTPATGLGGEPNPLDGTWVSQPLTRADAQAGLAGGGPPAPRPAVLAGPGLRPVARAHRRLSRTAAQISVRVATADSGVTRGSRPNASSR